MWILIFILHSAAGVHEPAAVYSIEFSTRQACEAARQRLADGMGPAGNLQMGCFAKG